jgi:polyferredoxin
MSQSTLPTREGPAAADADADPATAPAGRDLLRYRPVAALLRGRWYPGVFQWAAGVVFVVVVWQLLAGPEQAHDNLGTALVWVAWWPAIPILFVTVGRFWCAVCPFGKLSDLVQRLVGVNRPVPRWLKKYGIWIIDAQFVLITWSDHVWGIVESPWGTGILLLLLTTAVIVSGAFFQRRTFCRYLCFLGGLAGNYTRAGALALHADPAVCATCKSRAVCFNGGPKAPACPMFEFPRTMDSSANCTLCANCVKNCPNGAISLTLRPPTTELWFVRTPRIEVSALAVAIMGIVFIQNITMLGVWQTVLDTIRDTTGVTNYPVIFTVAFISAIALPAGLLGLAATVSARVSGRLTRATVVTDFARFGYALIPLDVAGHLAHNLFHLLAEGGSVWNTALATLEVTGHDGPTAYLSTGAIQVLQYVVVALGIAGSAYAAHRIARSHRPVGRRARPVAGLVPYLVLIAALGAVNAVLFAMPMSMRM